MCVCVRQTDRDWRCYILKKKEKGKLTFFKTYYIPDTIALLHILSHLIFRQPMWNICYYPIFCFKKCFSLENFKHKQSRQSYSKSLLESSHPFDNHFISCVSFVPSPLSSHTHTLSLSVSGLAFLLGAPVWLRAISVFLCIGFFEALNTFSAASRRQPSLCPHSDYAAVTITPLVSLDEQLQLDAIGSCVISVADHN